MTRCLEVEDGRRAPYLGHDGAEGRAADSLRCGAQDIRGVAGPHHDEGGGIGAKGGQPLSMKPAGFAIQEIRPHGDNGAPAGGPHRQAECKSCRRHAVRFRPGEDFMQRSAREPPFEGYIDGVKAESESLGRA